MYRPKRWIKQTCYNQLPKHNGDMYNPSVKMRID